MLSLRHQCLSTSHWIHLYTTLMTCSFYFIVIFRIIFRRKDVSLYMLPGMVTHVCYLYDIDFFSYYSSSFYFIVKGKPISKLWKRNQSPHTTWSTNATDLRVPSTVPLGEIFRAWAQSVVRTRGGMPIHLPAASTPLLLCLCFSRAGLL